MYVVCIVRNAHVQVMELHHSYYIRHQSAKTITALMNCLVFFLNHALGNTYSCPLLLGLSCQSTDRSSGSGRTFWIACHKWECVHMPSSFGGASDTWLLTVAATIVTIELHSIQNCCTSWQITTDSKEVGMDSSLTVTIAAMYNHP